MIVIIKVVILFTSEFRQFADQEILRLIIHLIEGISGIIKKLLKLLHIYNTIIIVLSKNLDLNLDDSESVIGFFRLSLQNWYKPQVVFE